jgi:pimeloyl-ACP methyl ester carboxylesterase
MRQCFCALFAVVLLLPYFIVSAQTTEVPACGNLIIPANYYYEGYEEYIEPITNCVNPLNADALVSFTASLHIADQLVSEGGVVTVPADGSAVPISFTMDMQSFGIPLDIYRREGDDYHLVYSARGALDDLIPALLPPGLYTAAFVYEEAPVFNQTAPSWLEQIKNLLISTAYANYPNYKQVQVVNFEIKAAAATPTGASSVLFLPGMEASRLYTNGLLGTEDQLWEANNNDDVRQLAMTTSGVSVNSVYTRDILGDVLFGYLADVYAKFANSMDKLVTEGTIKAWTPFAYDWRYSVDDISQNGTQYQHEIRSVVAEVERLASSSFSGKVTIVGHSNGGLLAKAVMIRLASMGKSNLVDTVVLLATPQLGTPKAIASLLHGYDQELGYGFLVDDAVARDVTVNVPGAYGLVPSQTYFAASTNTLIRFDNSTSTQLFRNAYGSTIDSLTELSAFMTGSGDGRPSATTVDAAMSLNGPLLQKEEAMHNTLDNWVAPAGVRVVEVIGAGLDTMSGIEYRGFTERVCSVLGIFSCTVKNMYKPVPLISQFGDKTVVGQSAEGYPGEKEQYFIDLEASDVAGGLFSVQHYNITENPSIQKLIKNILVKATSSIDFISHVPQVEEANRILVGSHSPVVLIVTDKQGRRTGKSSNSQTQPFEDIPGSSYFELGSSSYVVVPDGVSYNMVMHGTDQGGLTFSLDGLKGETQTPLVSIRVATITPSTTVTVSYATTTLTNLSVDQNGDGIVDKVLTPQGVDITPKVTYATLKATIQKLSLSVARKAALLLLETAAETLDKNLKLVTLERAALGELEVLLTAYQKNNWITATDLSNLKDMISKLK